MKIPIEITIPELWGSDTFKKDEWGSLNYLVGPNGTGKSKFIEHLKQELPKKNPALKIRYVSTDRIVGFTSNQYLNYMSSNFAQGVNLDWFNDLETSSKSRGEIYDAFVLLRNRLDIKIKVESMLSQLLNRTIILEERGGYLKPQVTKAGKTYSFKDNESHG